MKSENSAARRFFLTGAMFLLCFGVSISEAGAQTSKRRTRRVRQPVVILPPVPQQQTDPEIVSRAGDEAQNQIFVQPAPENQTTVPVDDSDTEIKDLRKRVKSLESTKKNEYDEKQKRLLLNLDILTRAETRSESLRKQLFDMIEKESGVKTRIEQLENDSRPEMIDRSVAFTGSLRPEEIRDARRRNMASEKLNLQSLLTEIQSSRASLETNVQKADQLVEKLRFKLEKDIDNALVEEERKP